MLAPVTLLLLKPRQSRITVRQYLSIVAKLLSRAATPELAIRVSRSSQLDLRKLPPRREVLARLADRFFFLHVRYVRRRASRFNDRRLRGRGV